MTRRVFIYGSCVSRDAFTFVANNFEIASYVARSSLASAFADRPFKAVEETVDLAALVPSAFQQRMIRIDLYKQLRQTLRHNPADVILVDFIDERFDLIVYDDAVATLSAELLQTKIHLALPQAKRIRYSAPERFEAWKLGLAEMLSIAADLKTPVVVNRVFWSKSDILGEPFKASEVDPANAILDKLYAELPHSVDLIEYREELIVADPNHKWGRSPFHFQKSFYERTIAAL